MWPASEVEKALELSAAGLNNCQIARQMGLPRRTISNWVAGRARTGADKSFSRRAHCMRCPGEPHPFPGLVSYAYAYLLGLYLGDGWIATHRRQVFRLRIYLDRKYPLIIAECEAAVSIIMPESRTTIYCRNDAEMDEVGSYSKHWPHLFPQHATGRKHDRTIALEPWQMQIVDRYPGRLLRGLIHSDGCRVTNRIRHPKRTYTYPRYFFSNRSLDIQRIFCEACDRLGIAWRQDGRWNISVARREAVEIMDRHVGPKR